MKKRSKPKSKAYLRRLNQAIANRFNEMQFPPALMTREVAESFNQGHWLKYDSNTGSAETFKVEEICPN
jgi:hypothetical protein